MWAGAGPGPETGPGGENEGRAATEGERGGRRVSRRHALGLAGKGAAGAVVLGAVGGAGYGIRGSSAAAPAAPQAVAPRPTRTIQTRPDLNPPHVQMVDIDAGGSSGYIFVTPSRVPGIRAMTTKQAIAAGDGAQGAMILDHLGELVWFHPTPGLATDLQVQTYRGEPVLTYWTGAIENGIGYGEVAILDSTYKQIATVKGANGLKADLHEIVLTPQGTAIVTAYATRAADLSAIGGPANGQVFDSVVQETDVATGKLVHEWRSLDHVPVTETYSKPAKGALDYFHVNSASLYDDDHLLLSSRSTWTLYKVDRSTGAVVWRLGGKNSDFTIGQGANFEWQHHSRRLGNGRITVFDDGAVPAVENTSRALVLNVDETHMTATLDKAYIHPAQLLAGYEGSVQVLANGHVFVGWGDEPYFTEFSPDGSVLLDGRFPTDDQSYRAFRSPWVGRPTSVPTIVAAKDSVGGVAIHASWNGATEVAHWQVLGGGTPQGLKPVALLAKAGFETAMTARTTGKYVAVAALDVHGKRLGVSRAVAI